MATFTALNGSRAFSADGSYLKLRADGKTVRVYWATTALHNELGDGRYEIHRVHSRRWEVRHHQVIQGGDAQIIRDLGFATTKGVAIRYAEFDHDYLADKVFLAVANDTGKVTA